jgi:transcriptional regulator with PAS, ATPase and Fis domain
MRENHSQVINNLGNDSAVNLSDYKPQHSPVFIPRDDENASNIQDTEEFIEESLSLVEKEKELILKALAKHHGKRKLASDDLGISERTLYRKIKEYDINL